MRIKCLSIKLESLVSISDKACLAKSFDGREAIIPKSQIFEPDYEVTKSEAYWIAEWILEKKNIQFSRKKIAWFDKETGELLPHFEIKKHIPEKVKIKNVKPDSDLKR
jgi:hypothetical protein